MNTVATLDDPMVRETDVRRYFGDVTPRTIARWRAKYPEIWRPDITIAGRRLYRTSTVKKIQAAMCEAAE